MKKILSLIVLLAGVISFTSCGNDDASYTSVASLEIVSANVVFDVEGGTGTIVVNNTGTITAEALTGTGWLTCSVSGNTVTVTAAENPGREGRSATIVLKSSDGSAANITATQTGVVYGLKKGTYYALNDNANELHLEIYHSKAVTVTSLSDWITASFNEETDMIDIQVEANNTGQMRYGYVEVSSGQFTDKVTISQFDFNKDIYGAYYLLFTESYDSEDYYYVEATLSETSLNFELYTGYTWSVPVTWDKSTSTVTVTSGTYVGQWRTYYIYLMFIDMVDGAWTAIGQSFSENTTMSAAIKAEVDEEGNVVTSGAFEGLLLDEYPLDGWNFQAFKSKSFTEAASLGYLTRIFNLKLEKVPANETAASRRSKIYNAKRFDTRMPATVHAD